MFEDLKWIWICTTAIVIAIIISASCRNNESDSPMSNCRWMCASQGVTSYDPKSGVCTCRTTCR